MTLNIWNLSGPWRERRIEIVAWLRRLEPDLVCLQEVIDNPDGRNQARWLAEEVGGYHVAYGGLPLGERVLFGNAVLSRWPIDAEHSDPLTHPPGDLDVPRVVVHARTNGLDVFSTHLNWKLDDGVAREAQVQDVVRAIETHADPASPLPPILGGDFNADPDSTEIRFLCGLASLGGRSTYFQDAWRVAGGGGDGYTWDNRNPFAAEAFEPDRRIDYVFVGWKKGRGAGRVETARVVCDRAITGTFASDHFGALIDVSTGEPGSTVSEEVMGAT